MAEALKTRRMFHRGFEVELSIEHDGSGPTAVARVREGEALLYSVSHSDPQVSELELIESVHAPAVAYIDCLTAGRKDSQAAGTAGGSPG